MKTRGFVVFYPTEILKRAFVKQADVALPRTADTLISQTPANPVGIVIGLGRKLQFQTSAAVGCRRIRPHDLTQHRWRNCELFFVINIVVYLKRDLNSWCEISQFLV